MGTLNVRHFILLTTLLLSFGFSFSQGGMYAVSSSEKTSNSTLIIEGKVISKKSLWNSQHTMIYTSNEVEVYKVFKGSLTKKTITVVTVGGNIDGQMVVASHQLSLEYNDVGVFYCTQTPISRQIGKDNGYDVYSSSQGFLKYDLPSKTAFAPFSKYVDLEHSLYTELFNKTGRRAEIKNKSFNVGEISKALTTNSSNSTLAPVVTSFSPASVNGGALNDPTNNVLTINGTGFGAIPSGSAAIQFAHSDMGPGNFVTIPFDSSLIISWSDVQIKLRVPTQAGTGTFNVRDNSGNLASSPTQLTVLYTVLTANFGTAIGPKQFNLANLNGSGGYSVVYSTNTANSGLNINTSTAKGTFQRALTTWKEGVGANIIEAGTTTIQAVTSSDGQNVVMFDNGGTTLGPMPSGVLATCYSYLATCGAPTITTNALKSGFDIVIRNAGYSSGTTPFTFGPCAPYTSTTGNVVDLETVVLHELGHALDLGHVIDGVQVGAGVGQSNPAKLMNFSVSFNVRRISLDYSAKVGAVFTVSPHSLSFGGCVTGEMTPLAVVSESKDECPGSFPTSTTPLFTSVPFDLVHATSNKSVDPNFTQVTTDGTGTSITNTAYYAFKTNSAGGDLSLEIQNYTTTPTAIAACVIGSAGVSVTGVQLALYQVSSCPGGQSYPTPAVSTTFKTSGVLPAITGLAADATYLMVLDGIEDTKATFDVVFSGSALPLKFNLFNGQIFTAFNTLSWETDKAYEVGSMNLERSPDGVTFEDIDVITDPTIQASGSFNDSRFLPGANYYRLAVHNTNGSIIYSKVVLLTRTETFKINIYPNPAVQTLNVEVLSNTTGKYGIVLHNALGQIVYQKQISVVPGNQVEEINVTRFRAGVYHLTVYGEGNNKVKSSTITIQN